MTNPMTIRLDDETLAKLDELGRIARARGRMAAIRIAISRAYAELQDEELAAGYAAAVAENPHYPHEDAADAAARRKRRARRDQ
jgi:predicted transcriptional regulator